ncbi:prepilin peptidase [archaeon]|nr:prepilin peptidase [archaeon]
MVFSFVYAAVAVLVLVIASYTDLKQRIVPNKLNYALIVSGLVLHLLESIMLNSIEPIMLSILGGLSAFFIAFVLYKIGGWAGGDVKLFAGLGALLPLPLFGLPAAPLYAWPLFPLMILTNSVLMAFPFVMFYVFFRTFRDPKLKDDFKRMVLSAIVKGVVFAGSAFGLFALLDSWSFLVLPLLILMAFLPSSVRHGLAGLLFVAGFVVGSSLESFVVLALMGILVGSFFEALTHGMKALRKEVVLKDLEEGMISSELILDIDGKIERVQRSFFQKAITPFPAGCIVSDVSAAGLTVSELKELRKLKVQSLLVKDSIPLVPILLLGCIASLVFGDLAWLIISIF